MEHGEVVHIDEVLAQSTALHGKCVRVLGTLTKADPGNGRARLEHRGCQLRVDTTMIPGTALQVGAWFQFLGEIQCPAPEDLPVLHARVGRNVNGIDVKLFEEALEFRRTFLKEAQALLDSVPELQQSNQQQPVRPPTA